MPMKYKTRAVFFGTNPRLWQRPGGGLDPAFRDLLDALAERGILRVLCIEGARNHPHAPVFDRAVSVPDPAGPDPENYLRAAAEIGVHPSHCLVLEDTESSVEGALRGGMKVIGVGRGEGLPWGPAVIDRFDEIDVEALLETGRPRYPEVDPWRMIETEINPLRWGYWESIFALTNGYMGLRGAHEEDDPALRRHATPGMFINGIYDYADYHHQIRYPGLPDRWHGMVNLCDWRIIRLSIDGEAFSFASGRFAEYRRELDMRQGILRRRIVWESPGGRRIRLDSVRLVSMVRRHAAVIRYEATPLNFSGRLEIESVSHPGAHSAIFGQNRIHVLESGESDDAVHFLMKPERTGFRIGMGIGHRLSAGEGAPPAEQRICSDAGAVSRFRAEIPEGRTLVVDKFAAFRTSEDAAPDRILSEIHDLLNRDMGDGFETLLREQQRFWESHWETADIRIEGNPADQQALRFNLFHLRQSHPEDPRRSISATGMTSDGYCGHVFWDTEMYLVPHFLYTDPALVRPLLEYRYGLLDRAREHARELFACPGALFAWNSINGEECGIVFEAASAQIHIDNAVAYAVWRYYRATDDRDFMDRFGAEILFETARFLAHRGRFIETRGGRFCINMVCGPDEYGCNVDNNCYTNLMTRFHLRFACRIFEEMRRGRPEILARLCARIGLDADEVDLWHRAAERMYIPYDEELRIHKADDSFLYRDPVDMETIPHYHDFRWEVHPLNLWRMQVIKQADTVLAMFTLADEFPVDQKRRDYEYYEPRTNHGSSLSPAIHAVVAAEIGRRDHAEQYLRDALYMDLFDCKNNTYKGVHAACLGGVWMAVVNGLAGMRDDEAGLRFRPMLPGGWTGCRFRLRYEGRLLEVGIEGDRASFTLLSGDALDFRVADRGIRLDPERPEAVVPLTGSGSNGPGETVAE